MAAGLILGTNSAAGAAAPAPAAVSANGDTVSFGPAAKTLLVSHKRTPVAPGVNLDSFERLDARGWLRGHVLTADLANPALTADLVYPGALTAAKPLTALAAGSGAVAAVNGDFFDIRNTKVPLGWAAAGGNLLKTAPAETPMAGVGLDRIGRVGAAILEGTVLYPGGQLSLDAVNQYTVPGNGIGVYTAVWGTAPRVGAAYGAEQVVEVTVREGKVVAVAGKAGDQPVPEGTYVLVGRENGARALSALKVGDPVTIRFGLAGNFRFAISGEAVILQDGQPVAGLSDAAAMPRTMIGFSQDGAQMWLAAVDGRSQASRGVTLLEAAELMQSLGAWSALALDGGGSTEMVARRPGEAAPAVINVPSDGEERRVPNGVGLFALPGSGKPAGLSVVSVVPGEGMERVFAGMFRQLTARVFDETYAPVRAGQVTWSATGGKVIDNGIFLAGRPGPATVTATADGVQGAMSIRVLGDLAGLAAQPAGLNLAPGGTAIFRVEGYDADGYRAPIDPINLSLSYDGRILRVTSLPSGEFVVTALNDGSELIRVRARGKEAVIPVAVGYTPVAVEAFDRPGAWTFSRFPDAVKGAVADTLGAGGGHAVSLTYDFSTGDAARAAYLQATDTGIPLPDAARRMAIWVKGDGKGAWLRAVVQDITGESFTLTLAQHVDWTGWRYLETALPENSEGSLRLTRIYPVETDKARKYAGELAFAGLIVREPVTAEAPPVAVQLDPLETPVESWAKDRWRFAVTDGGGEAARAAALAAGAELVVDASTGFRTEDYRGTRFITLDSGRARSLRMTDFSQFGALRAALDGAAADPAVANVVVVARHGTGSLIEPQEGRLLETWLAGFREQSGKGALFISAAGDAVVRRVEGVPHAGAGGFRLFGVSAGPDWLRIAR